MGGKALVGGGVWIGNTVGNSYEVDLKIGIFFFFSREMPIFVHQKKENEYPSLVSPPVLTLYK